MKRIILITAFFISESGISGVPDIVNSAALTGKDPVLNKKEWHAAKLAHSWINAKSKPFIKEEGKILYTFGVTLPSVICAPLKVCDIELEPGEKIKNVMLGDTTRWQVKPAVSGSEQGLISHIVVKPFEVGLVSTMMVTTDRRTYHFKLLSRKSNYMPRIAFVYPEKVNRQWDVYYANYEKSQHRKIIPATGEKLDDLFFDYEISGDSPPWKPVRVYNNGIKTIIQMPKAMAQTEAPALLVVGADGQGQIVNYRLKGDRYIVDQIFEEAMLISGVGRRQMKVEIELNSEKFFNRPQLKEGARTDEIVSN